MVGGGPIGQACILAARRLGAERIVVSEPNPTRRALTASLGAVVVDPTTDGLPEAVGNGLDGPPNLVLDAVGTSGSLADALTCTSFGARVVLVRAAPGAFAELARGEPAASKVLVFPHGLPATGR